MINSRDKVSQVARLLGLYHGYEYDAESIDRMDYDRTVDQWRKLITLHNAQFPDSDTYRDLGSIIDV